MGSLPVKLSKKQLTQDPLKLLLDAPAGNHDNYPKTFLAIPTKVLEKHTEIELMLEAAQTILHSIQRRPHPS